MDLYDYLQIKSDDGCLSCPFMKDCDQGAGYTEMDEHGSCPVKNINSQEDFDNAKFPIDYPNS